MLNQEQSNAFNRLTAFLLSKEHAIIVDGSGGTGKSYLIKELKKNLLKEYRQLCSVMGETPLYHNIHITSTTNKACESLSVLVHEDVPTIHSYLGLRVKENWKTGEDTLETTDKFSIITNTVIIIDECSMINWQLFKYIEQACSKCKIIYVGDKYQLAPVKQKISDVYVQGYTEIPLTTFMRQQNQVLTDFATQCKNSVDTHNINIQTVPDVIELLDKEQTFKLLDSHFKDPHNKNKICCYTNACCIAYNDFIHTNVRKYDKPFYIGQHLVSNSTLHDLSSKNAEKIVLHTEDIIEITQLDDKPQELSVKGTKHTVKFNVLNGKGLNLCNNNTVSLLLPLNPFEYKEGIKCFVRDKDWKHYYELKDFIPDLRYADACTVHKAQGATVDNVLIDLDNLSTCTNTDMFFRLLYVASTRARHKIYFFGSLAKRFGTII